MSNTESRVFFILFKRSEFSDDEDDDSFNRPIKWIKEEDLVDLVTGSDVQLQIPSFSLSPIEVDDLVFYNNINRKKKLLNYKIN